MPWALHTLNSSEPLRKRTYFLTREKVVIGRKEGDGNDIVVGKKSVSRKHATIRIAETSFNVRRLDSRPSIVIEDHSSFGTSINGININKFKKELRDGDTIQFAKSQTVFKVQFVPIVICVTGVGSSKRKEMLRQTFRKLGIHYQSIWGEHVTHILTERPLTITVKFLRALLCGIPVINREWIERILARATLDEPLPRESECLLSLDGGARRYEATGQVESIYSVKKERKTLFKHCSFVFVSQSEFVWMVRAGGGHAYEFHEMSKSEIDDVVLRAEKSESSNPWFFVRPFTDLSSQRRGETQASQQEIESSRGFYDRMMRVKANEVGEDMIGQCIVSCKTSTLYGKTDSTTMVIKDSHPTNLTSSNTSSLSLTSSTMKKSPVVKKISTPVKEKIMSPKETPSKWSSMSYNQLRKELKKRGIKAGGKKVNLLKRLEEYEMQQQEDIVVKKNKVQSKKMESEDSKEISSRQKETTSTKKTQEVNVLSKKKNEKVIRNEENASKEKANTLPERKKRTIIEDVLKESSSDEEVKSSPKKKKNVKQQQIKKKKEEEKGDAKALRMHRTATTENDGWLCPRRHKKAEIQTEKKIDDSEEEEKDESVVHENATQTYDREEEQEQEEKEEVENVPPSVCDDLAGVWVTKKKKKKRKISTSESHPEAVVESRTMIVKRRKEEENKKSPSRKYANNKYKGVNFKRFRKNSIVEPCTTPVAFASPMVPNETQEERERRRLFEDDIMNEKKADMVWDFGEKDTKKKRSAKRRRKKS